MKYLVLLACLALLSCNSKKDLSQLHNDAHSHDGNNAHAHDKEDAHNSYFGSYSLQDATYGTQTIVTVKDNVRTMVTNALPNHTTGDFPNQGNPNTISAQNRTYNFTMTPKYTGNSQWVREPGVALNGVKFEPGTAEVVACETGENYRVEAMQDVFDLGLDENHAHVQPTGAYHYHGTPTAVIENFDTGRDLVHIGFAHDGFPMYYSKSAAYKPSFKEVEGDRSGTDCSYENPHQSIDVSVGGHHDGTYTSDFEYVAGSGDLDECNGITINGEYMYLVTAEFPYISRCLMGDFDASSMGGPPSGGRPPRGGRPQGPPHGKRPDKG